jgi:acyl carrier protein
MEPVPVGVPGEIYIGGAGVARGYLGRAGLTAERFVPDPFSPTPGGRLYRTGDLGRFLADGNLEYLGRNDHQVKIGGHRVEPGEVEAALRRHPGVRGTVVTAHEFGSHDRRLVAYVVTDEPTQADELRGFLAQRLPAHMVPSLFVPLDALPVSASGKVDRGRLPDPQPNQLGQEREFVAARTPLEKEIAELFAEVLHLDRVGLHDNFFELGGTSILLVEVNNRLAHVYGMDRNLTQMLQAPTVAATARMIAATQEQGREAVLAAGTVRAEVDAHLDASINPDWSMTDTPATAR